MRASLTCVRKVNGRYHRVVKIHRRIEDKKSCLVFCPIRYNDKDFKVIIHAMDLYLVGLKGECDTCFILFTDTNFETLDMKKILECFCEHHQLKIDFIQMDQSYSALELVLKDGKLVWEGHH